MIGTLTRNDTGQYVPFRSRALGSPTLAVALAGKPLHARVRNLGRAFLGYSTEAADKLRGVTNAITKRRRLNKLAGCPAYNRIGGTWTRTMRGRCSRSWRHG